MTEDELHAKRRADDLVNKAAHEDALDQAAIQLQTGDAIAVVSRREAAGGDDRDFRRQNLRLACAMRMLGSTQKEIAEELGMSERAVRRLLHEGQLLTQRKSLELLELRAIPQAMDNLVKGLEAGNERYTIETLKGGGILKAHSKHDGSFSGPPVAMQIVFQAPAGSSTSIPAGASFGQPITTTPQED